MLSKILKDIRQCSREKWFDWQLIEFWLSHACRASCERTRGKPSWNFSVLLYEWTTEQSPFWPPVMGQWRMCASKTLLTTQARQGRNWWSESHQEPRNSFYKTYVLYKRSGVRFHCRRNRLSPAPVEDLVDVHQNSAANRIFFQQMVLTSTAEVRATLLEEQCLWASDNEWPVAHCYEEDDESATEVVFCLGALVLYYRCNFVTMLMCRGFFW